MAPVVDADATGIASKAGVAWNSTEAGVAGGASRATVPAWHGACGLDAATGTQYRRWRLATSREHAAQVALHRGGGLRLRSWVGFS